MHIEGLQLITDPGLELMVLVLEECDLLVELLVDLFRKLLPQLARELLHELPVVDL